jgi:hypothetical protein
MIGVGQLAPSFGVRRILGLGKGELRLRKEPAAETAGVTAAIGLEPPSAPYTTIAATRVEELRVPIFP